MSRRRPDDWEFKKNDTIIDIRNSAPWPMVVFDHAAGVYLLFPFLSSFDRSRMITRTKNEIEENFVLVDDCEEDDWWKDDG